jgi:hypothetical protein
MAFQLGAPSLADGDVRPDGSGQMTLTHLENPAHESLSATVTWTCTPAAG